MLDVQIIRSYLVKLGFSVDKAEATKFTEAIKRSAADAEQFAKNLTKTFAVAGLAVAGALTAIGVGLVDLFTNTANQDLKFQVLARRMLTTTDAARKMSIALDALGYSVEDIIGGPPELRERYKSLIDYQTGLSGMLLGNDFEGSMRKIRDIEFEFTKAKVAAQYLGMAITEEVVERLTGTNSLGDAIKKIDAYLTPEKIKQYADWVSGKLVPAIQLLGRGLEWIANLDYAKMWASLESGYAKLKSFMDVINPHSDQNKGSVWSGVWDNAMGRGTDAQQDERKGKLWDYLFTGGKGAIIDKLTAAARKYGVDPAAALAIADKESGMNPNAPRGSKGEYGMMQVMPFNAQGRDLNTLDGDIDASMLLFSQKLKASGGDYRSAFEHYNGAGPAARSYADDVMKRYGDWKYGGYSHSGDPSVQPQAYHLDMGGVTVHVNGTNASADEIAAKVQDKVAKAQQAEWQRLVTQSQGVYA